MSFPTAVELASPFMSSDWWTRAACAGYDPEWWSDDRTMRPLAVEICLTCPVRAACLDDAIRTGDKGVVRGGMLILDSRRRRGERAVDLVCSQCRANPVVMTATGQDRYCRRCAGQTALAPRRRRRPVRDAHP